MPNIQKAALKHLQLQIDLSEKSQSAVETGDDVHYGVKICMTTFSSKDWAGNNNRKPTIVWRDS